MLVPSRARRTASQAGSTTCQPVWHIKVKIMAEEFTYSCWRVIKMSMNTKGGNLTSRNVQILECQNVFRLKHSPNFSQNASLKCDELKSSPAYCSRSMVENRPVGTNVRDNRQTIFEGDVNWNSRLNSLALPENMSWANWRPHREHIKTNLHTTLLYVLLPNPFIVHNDESIFFR